MIQADFVLEITFGRMFSCFSRVFYVTRFLKKRQCTFQIMKPSQINIYYSVNGDEEFDPGGVAQHSLCIH